MTRPSRIGATLLIAAAGTAGLFALVAGPAPADDKPKFAEGKGGPMAPAAAAVPFDAARAKKYVDDLCDLGPRVSATPAMAKQIELLTAHFEKHGGKVVKQSFEAKQDSRKEKTAFTNLIVQWNPDRPRRVILCAHYDTRPVPHEEPDRKNWNRPFHSANDGTSGVAMLMEMAPGMKDLKTPVGVDFVFFDAEEYIFEPTGAFGGGDRFFIGSDHFAAEYAKLAANRKFKYEAAVLFDLFAHAGAVYRVEGHSFAFAPRLSHELWQVAAANGAKAFKYEAGPDVRDDHLALNRAGIPAVDVIDFEGYRDHWHKLSDTPDKISGDQMKVVAGVMAAWLQGMK